MHAVDAPGPSAVHFGQPCDHLVNAASSGLHGSASASFIRKLLHIEKNATFALWFSVFRWALCRSTVDYTFTAVVIRFLDGSDNSQGEECYIHAPLHILIRGLQIKQQSRRSALSLVGCKAACGRRFFLRALCGSGRRSDFCIMF